MSAEFNRPPNNLSELESSTQSNRGRTVWPNNVGEIQIEHAPGRVVVRGHVGGIQSTAEQSQRARDGGRTDYGGGGLFGRLAPTGDPRELAKRIMIAIATDQARMIYPRLYQAGWVATNLASWFALSYGPPPLSR